MIRFFRKPALSTDQVQQLLFKVQAYLSLSVPRIRTEFCFYVESKEPLNSRELAILRWLLAETFGPANFADKPLLRSGKVFEVGPRMNFTTSWSNNAVSIFQACGLGKITRIERSRRYKLEGVKELIGEQRGAFYSLIHDRMTEMPYLRPLETFGTGLKPEPVRIIPLLEEGRVVLERINREMGLAMDNWDIDYYQNLFVDVIGRNPTDVELSQLGNQNSEHSRHWFFKGKMIIDGQEMSECLLEIVKSTLSANPRNSLIAFSDNSSAISGYDVWTIVPTLPDRPSPFGKERFTYHLVFTAETHNYPSGVAPFPGAETGTGGRQRDNSDTGQGSFIVAGTAAYCVGQLLVPGYHLAWEDKKWFYPKNLASAVEIEIGASNGASDYGNKFGEPLILGFTRSFGMRLPNGERREWIKPIMFTGGIGQIDDRHIRKGNPEKGMLVVKIGGPAYRIGVCGGSASSMFQGQNIEELDFNAVQRGDAEMAKKTYNVIRACVEMGEKSPIVSIHDQGAGGRANVETEIINPAGARIKVRSVWIGDHTLSVLEIWVAEYQEQHALLISPERIKEFGEICQREKVNFAIAGEITGDGYLVLFDEKDGSQPVNLELAKILGKLPQKTFNTNRQVKKLEPLSLPRNLTIRTALGRVLRLLSVGSKRFLTTKVDRSVTGLISQQQCVGPLQLTVADFGLVAQSHFGLSGGATSIGEQPIKGLISPKVMARLSVAEAITNLAGVKVSNFEDIKCSANWMWAAKFPGEGTEIYDAAVAMRDIMVELGIAVDGGKDSLSMATQVTPPSGEREMVKSPGELVISAYVTCPDITKKVTPDIKRPGESRLIYIDLGEGKYRLGGSALAQVYRQLGDESPDLENPDLLKRAFNAIQELIDNNSILAYHDRSDGGLIVSLLEMAFAGNCGLIGNLDGVKRANPLEILFSEEMGMVFEYLSEKEAAVREILQKHNLLGYSLIIGETTLEKKLIIRRDNHSLLKEDMPVLRDIWEETSYQLDLLQANPECVKVESIFNYNRQGPEYHLTFTPEPTPPSLIEADNKPKVAILREEGSNGDREMASAFFLAGFEPWDVTVTDLLKEKVNLSDFRGIAFVGGFSYGDVLDSAKGWSAVIRFNPRLWQQFQDFYNRADTFSLGVCNGCQLMALLGWVPWPGIEDKFQPRFIRNNSGRFESRWSTVKILPSPAILLKGMEGSVLGIWSAHGEGRAYFPKPMIQKKVIRLGLAPIRYVDDTGQPTEAYPFNPNGSPLGITALCSPDGRHLALMPHPERTFLLWQWPWLPEGWRRDLKASPWLRLFQNAREWCE